MDKFVKESKTHRCVWATPSARRVATRASGRACALSRGGHRAVGHVVHSQTLLRHCATSARALRNEPSETRARPLQARASQIAPIDGTLEDTTLVLVKIVSSSVKIDVRSAELHFGTRFGTVLPGPASYTFICGEDFRPGNAQLIFCSLGHVLLPSVFLS